MALVWSKGVRRFHRYTLDTFNIDSYSNRSDNGSFMEIPASRSVDKYICHRWRSFDMARMDGWLGQVPMAVPVCELGHRNWSHNAMVQTILQIRRGTS